MSVTQQDPFLFIAEWFPFGGFNTGCPPADGLSLVFSAWCLWITLLCLRRRPFLAHVFIFLG